MTNSNNQNWKRNQIYDKCRFLVASVALVLNTANAAISPNTVSITDKIKLDASGRYYVYKGTTIPNNKKISGDLVVNCYLGETRASSDSFSDVYDWYGTIIGDFSDCTGLLSAKFVNDGHRSTYYSYAINFEKMVVGAFRGCTSLTSVTLPSTILIIPEEAFKDCSRLESVTHCSGQIDANAFSGCAMLRNFKCQDLIDIGANAFCGCSSLSDLTFGANLKTMGANSFLGVADIGSLSFATKPPTGIRESHILDSVEPGNVSFPAEYAETWKSIVVESSTNCAVFITGAQRYPWNGRVALECLIDTELDAEVSLRLVAYDSVTGEELPIQSVWSLGGSVTNKQQRIKCGKPNHFIWDASSDLPAGFVSSNVVVGILGRHDAPSPFTLDLRTPSRIASPEEVISYDSAWWTDEHPVVDGAKVESVVYENGTEIKRFDAGAGTFSWSPVGFGRRTLVYSVLVDGVDVDMGYKGTFYAERAKVTIVSSRMREGNPTVMDVVYRVDSVRPTARVRALAFEDGVRSWAKALRVTDFIEGTDANIGDEIPANRELKLSWNVPADWKTDLAKVKFEVLAVVDDLLPVKYSTVPETTGHAAVRFSRSFPTAEKVNDALYWAYADGAEGLVLTDGVLTFGGKTLANGSALVDAGAALEFVFMKMGYDVLKGEELNYVNSILRLSLEQGSGLNQHGIKTLVK